MIARLRKRWRPTYWLPLANLVLYIGLVIAVADTKVDVRRVSPCVEAPAGAKCAEVEGAIEREQSREVNCISFRQAGYECPAPVGRSQRGRVGGRKARSDEGGGRSGVEGPDRSAAVDGADGGGGATGPEGDGDAGPPSPSFPPSDPPDDFPPGGPGSPPVDPPPAPPPEPPQRGPIPQLPDVSGLDEDVNGLVAGLEGQLP